MTTKRSERPAVPDAPPRRTPTQKRARERVERMLAAAEALIVERGIGNLKVNEVAERAGVPIGSVYEYFSGREDILQAIAERHHRAIEERTQSALAPVKSVRDLLLATRTLINGAWAYVRENQGYRELLCGVQAWEQLRDLDWQDSFANATLIADAMAPLVPNIDREDVIALSLIICDAAGSVARLAMHFDAYDARVQRLYADMVCNQIIELVRLDGANAPATPRVRRDDEHAAAAPMHD